jgi:hypothetical protein
MINAALAYRRAIHEFTLDETNGLLDFVLSTEEWNILMDLRDVLLVRIPPVPVRF